jgi:hypothetical protein
MRSIIFRDVTPCNQADVHSLSEERTGSIFRVPKVSHASGWLFGYIFDPEDGSRKFLRNAGELLPDYTELHPG